MNDSTISRRVWLAIKRLLFVATLAPASVFAFCRWIATGKNPADVMVAIERWRDA